MAGTVNKVILIGHLGAKPEIRTMQSGCRVATLSIATSESWKDKNTGERKSITQWHRVVVFNDGLVGILERYTDKGSKLYIEGRIENRSWDGTDGKKNYTTEIVLRPYRGEITLLDGTGGNNSPAQQTQSEFNQDITPYGDLDDEIPF